MSVFTRCSENELKISFFQGLWPAGSHVWVLQMRNWIDGLSRPAPLLFLYCCSAKILYNPMQTHKGQARRRVEYNEKEVGSHTLSAQYWNKKTLHFITDLHH